MSDEKLDKVLECVIRLEEQFKGHLKDHVELRSDHDAIAKEVLSHDKKISEAETTLRNLKWLAGASGIGGPALWVAVTKWFRHG